MRDQTPELFRAALGLAEPWMVSQIEFSEDQRQLDLWLDSPSGSRFACPECGRSGCGVYDTSERTWRRLNYFEHQTLLHARQPRIEYAQMQAPCANAGPLQKCRTCARMQDLCTNAAD